MQRNQFSLLTQLQSDLKKYKNVFKESAAAANQNLDGLSSNDQEFFVNLQNKAKNAIQKGDSKAANEAKDELMNFLKQKNAENNSSHKP